MEYCRKMQQLRALRDNLGEILEDNFGIKGQDTWDYNEHRERHNLSSNYIYGLKL